MKATFHVQDVFNITGRGTVMAGPFTGAIKAGDSLIGPNGEDIPIRAIEMANPHSLIIGILVHYDYEAARSFVGITLESTPHRLYVIFNEKGRAIGVMDNYKAATDYVYENHEKNYSWKGFTLNEKLEGDVL